MTLQFTGEDDDKGSKEIRQHENGAKDGTGRYLAILKADPPEFVPEFGQMAREKCFCLFNLMFYFNINIKNSVELLSG